MQSLKYLFLDTGILNGHWCANMELKVNPAVKDTKYNPLFQEEFFADPPKPWEVRYDNGYLNVFYDEEKKIFRLYYTLIIYDEDSQNTPLKDRPGKLYMPTSSRITAVCYAESEDGTNWVKPDLGLVEFKGNTHNNILMRNAHGTSVLYDKEEKEPAKRYKLMTKIEFSSDCSYMAVAFSADGIHFCDPIPWPKFNPQADTYNFVFRDSRTNRFVLITRIWKNGLRVAARCESEDFLFWSEPVEVGRGQGYPEQIYSMPVFEYERLYLGLASVYHEGNRDSDDFDTVDLRLTYSTDLSKFEWVGEGQNFIPRGSGHYPDGQFDCGCIYASIPVEIDGRLYFYYMGGNGRHTDYRETSFARCSIEKDHFAYYQTLEDEKEGVLTTAGLFAFGNSLEILAEVEPDGYIVCELTDSSGVTRKPAFEERLSRPVTGSGWQTVLFEDFELTQVKELPVSLRFRFKHARLYGLRGDIHVLPHRY